ncbi:hypothetical protein CYMTET_53311 [Cymbomonas tetramitiformis]|uniref:Uncharacterized protein n=1 Tax=Cymbomonas tetramitiformis TaxID=36881 RepID=A0AAE0BIJ0_9CHLO|nr:hypothetical protein CYMTET_53311 [Cymbomonas tetramitiformis]
MQSVFEDAVTPGQQSNKIGHLFHTVPYYKLVHELRTEVKRQKGKLHSERLRRLVIAHRWARHQNAVEACLPKIMERWSGSITAICFQRWETMAESSRRQKARVFELMQRKCLLRPSLRKMFTEWMHMAQKIKLYDKAVFHEDRAKKLNVENISIKKESKGTQGQLEALQGELRVLRMKYDKVLADNEMLKSKGAPSSPCFTPRTARRCSLRPGRRETAE